MTPTSHTWESPVNPGRFTIGLYPSYGDLVEVEQNFQPSMTTCLNRLSAIRVGGGRFHNMFELEKHKGSATVDGRLTASMVETYLIDVYRPARDLLLQSAPDASTHAVRVSTLFAPMSSVEALTQKIAQESSSWDDRLGGSSQVMMERLLAPEAVRLHVDYLLDAHFYYQLLTPDNRQLIPFNTLMAAEKPLKLSGYFALYEALSLIDIAIAQQSLLSGDRLLPILDAALRDRPDGSDASKRRRELASDIVRHNSTIARNYVLYALRKQVIEKSNFISYAVAHGSSSADLMNRVTGEEWAFSQVASSPKEDSLAHSAKGGWLITLDDVAIPVPTPEELAAGTLLQTPDQAPLLMRRSRILEEIAGYDILKEADPRRRARFVELLINAM